MAPPGNELHLEQSGMLNRDSNNGFSGIDMQQEAFNRFGELDLRRRRKLKSLDPPLIKNSRIRRISGKRSSYQMPRPATLTSKAMSSSRIHYLPRGGTVVMTEIGAVQFGIPPETIKDSLSLNLEVPQFYVVPHERFCCKIGAQQGLNLAEFEFPAYFNFFMKQGRKIVLVVDNNVVKNCIQQVFQETLLGPEEWDPKLDFVDTYPEEKKPMMMEELKYFQKFGSHQLTVDLLLQFQVFGSAQEVTLRSEKDPTKFITIYSTLDEYIIFDSNRNRLCSVPTEIKIPVQNNISIRRFRKKGSFIGFTPPAFGVTVLGSSHGFDPKGRTSGYVLWINYRGLMIDPPPNSTHLLQKNCIPACLIDAVVVTHCHADHDAGTFQKILQEGKITLITTPTIMGGFLRKYSALAGLEISFLKTVFKFRPVKIGEKMTFHGGKLSFFYTLHSIPCVGFEAYYGGKSIVFSADHMNDPNKIHALYDEGILTKARRDDLLNFPWHHDLILHEAGVPPIHTPIETLLGLSQEIKQKLYIVHVSITSIPKNSGLKAAKAGCENTIVIEGVVPPNYSEQLLKIDLITGIEMFCDLKLKKAAEIFTSAEVETFSKGQLIMSKGEEADSFFVIQSGVAEVKVERTRSLDDIETGEEQQRRWSRALSESEVGETFNQLKHRTTEPTSSEANEELPKQENSPSIPFDRSWTSFKRKQSLKASMQKPDTIEFNSADFSTKTYYPGDFFGESCLISDLGVREESIVALTDVTVLRCEKKSFLSILEETDVLKRLRHLERMRERGTLDVIESNSMLRLLSQSQKTQLETYFIRKFFSNDEVVWESGDECNFAILVNSGNLAYTESRAIYKRRGSGVHCDVSVLYDDIRGSSMSSSSLPQVKLPDIRANTSSSTSHIHNNDVELANELMIHRNGDSDLHKSPENGSCDDNDSDHHLDGFLFKRGAFIGDVDGLFYNGDNKVGLKAVGNVSVFCVLKKDLQKFFKKNPGVLLSMMHTQFIT